MYQMNKTGYRTDTQYEPSFFKFPVGIYMCTHTHTQKTGKIIPQNDLLFPTCHNYFFPKHLSSSQIFYSDH